uniref:Uncharacterized protein n=1 Tax=Rhizochromulina marina TaxID=1034831 RepID=A0A7S2WTA9_9STRA|mmetsp:Transcript_32737/g.94756  ORF Transcript_32737/g.94756 Transcript_32737/m.94756 type:complete len:420 (+) Transcript_32737:3-1262(+)
MQARGSECLDLEAGARALENVSAAIGHWQELQPSSRHSSPTSTNGAPPRAVLFGTAEAQARIHALQHPEARVCRSPATKFLVLNTGILSTGHGIGSLLHIVASCLALAQEMGRVLVAHPGDDNVFSQDPQPGTAQAARLPEPLPFCGTQTSLECFFLPISSCTMADAMALSNSGQDLPWYVPSRHEEFLQASAPRVLQVTMEPFKMIPAVLKDIAEPPAGYKWSSSRSPWYWARAQNTAFLMRPNEKTRRALASRRAKAFGGSDMAPGTVSAHVRHGDKGIEMQVVAMDDFVSAAELLRGLAPGLLPLRQLFVSTEDPAVISRAQHYASLPPDQAWDVSFVDVERSNLPLSGLISTFGGVNEMLNGLLNLQLAVNCDAWVMTIASNWCILIDELRATVAQKASHPLVDVGFRCFQGCED